MHYKSVSRLLITTVDIVKMSLSGLNAEWTECLWRMGSELHDFPCLAVYVPQIHQSIIHSDSKSRQIHVQQFLLFISRRGSLVA